MNREAALSELLSTVRQVEVAASRLANDSMVGAYLSSFKGRGMDFEELREYLPGDDVRHIDWNVTNRLGRPFVKRYREERELTMILAVDISASGDFASVGRTKRHLAAEVAGTLAFSAARSGDKVGLMLFTGEVELYVPPSKGRRHLLRLLREILFFEPKHRGTSVAAALRNLHHRLGRRSMVFLLSDFLQPTDRTLAQAVGQLSARHDMVCLHLHDPGEAELPDAGLVTLEDAETGELVELNLSRAAVREQYAAVNARRLAELNEALQREGVSTLRLETGKPFAAGLQHFFEHRRWRRG